MGHAIRLLVLSAAMVLAALFVAYSETRTRTLASPDLNHAPSGPFPTMAGHGLNVALCATPGVPVELPPAPPAHCSREVVVATLNALLVAARPELQRCKRTGGFAELTSAATVPAQAGVVLSFPSPSAIVDIMRRMHAGETVDPAMPLHAHDAHGLLATFCGADGALSGKLYEHAVAFAARHGRAFSDVLLMVLTNYVDESGEAQQLQTVLLDI